MGSKAFLFAKLTTVTKLHYKMNHNIGDTTFTVQHSNSFPTFTDVPSVLSLLRPASADGLQRTFPVVDPPEGVL